MKLLRMANLLAEVVAGRDYSKDMPVDRALEKVSKRIKHHQTTPSHLTSVVAKKIPVTIGGANVYGHIVDVAQVRDSATVQAYRSTVKSNKAIDSPLTLLITHYYKHPDEYYVIPTGEPPRHDALFRTPVPYVFVFNKAEMAKHRLDKDDAEDYVDMWTQQTRGSESLDHYRTEHVSLSAKLADQETKKFLALPVPESPPSSTPPKTLDFASTFPPKDNPYYHIFTNGHTDIERRSIESRTERFVGHPMDKSAPYFTMQKNGSFKISPDATLVNNITQLCAACNYVGHPLSRIYFSKYETNYNGFLESADGVIKVIISPFINNTRISVNNEVTHGNGLTYKLEFSWLVDHLLSALKRQNLSK